MNDKLSTRKISAELEILRSRIRGLEQKLETSLAQAVSRFRKLSGDIQRDQEGDMDDLVISKEYRRNLIAKTAYLRAERRGFQGGSPEQDWLQAEAEVDSYLMEGHAPIMEYETEDSQASEAADTRKSGDLGRTLSTPADSGA